MSEPHSLIHVQLLMSCTHDSLSQEAAPPKPPRQAPKEPPGELEKRLSAMALEGLRMDKLLCKLYTVSGSNHCTLPALPCPALLMPALPCSCLPCPALPCSCLPCLALPCLCLPCFAHACLGAVSPSSRSCLSWRTWRSSPGRSWGRSFRGHSSWWKRTRH